MPPKKVIRRAPAKPPASSEQTQPAIATTDTPAQAAPSNGEGQAAAAATTDSTAAADSTGPAEPAATPSTTAKKLPVKRLDTLARPPSIGSPSSRTGATAGTAAAGRASVKPKFVGRRSQTARAELEKAEAERVAAEAAARAKREGRFRGRGDGDRGRGRGRGRGGFMGEREKLPTGASGPFSMGIVSADAGRARMGRVGGGGGGTMFGGGGSGGGGGGGGDGNRYVMRSSGIKTEDGDGDVSMGQMQDGGYISSDDEGEDKGVQRKNVDELEVIDLTNDDNNPARNFVPLRIPRHIHKDRTLGLNADGAATAEAVHSEVAAESGADAAKKRKGKQRAKDVEFTGEKEKYHGNWSSSSETENEPVVKEEPTEENNDALQRASTPEPASSNVHPPDLPSSPESRRKSKDKQKDGPASPSSKVKKPVFQTQEESDEWDRHQNDLRILHEELGTLALPTTAAAPATDGDGDSAMPTAGAEPTEQPRDRRAEKVYLFQFPPVLPDLSAIQVKPDPETNPEGDSAVSDPMAVDPAPNTTSQSVVINDDKGSHLPKLPAGVVGKLRIHRSGRATLDWGGTPLSVGMGTDASFLQDILVADMADAGTKAAEGAEGGSTVKGEDRKGTAMAMGQVKGKFVVTPDWEAMLG